MHVLSRTPLSARAAPSTRPLDDQPSTGKGLEKAADASDVNVGLALKDDRLVYRACTAEFAEALGLHSPAEVIGRTDFELLPGHTAREQMALDSRAIYTRQADVGAIELGGGRELMVMRSPVFAHDGRVCGVDLRVLSEVGPVSSSSDPDRAMTPGTATAIDYQTLVDEGVQGSLILTGRELLFANEQAARTFGFSSASGLVAHGDLTDLFDEAERARLTETAHARELAQATELSVSARSRDGDWLTLYGRVHAVTWGTRRAMLFSFVDVSSLPRQVLVRPAAPANNAASALAGAPRGVIGTVSPTAVGNSPSAMALQQENDELRASARRFRHYATAAADFFWETDAALAFQHVTPEFAAALGVPVEHLTGRTYEQLAEHPSNADNESEWRARLDRLQDREAFTDVEFRWTVGGDTRVIRCSGIPVMEQGEFLGYRGVGRDVTAATRQAEAVAYHANHDALTGLANRRHFESLVAEVLENAPRERRTHALCYLDLDNFKPVNDTCGHQAGDELLRQLAQLFDNLVRKSDVLARLGGDEFGVFLYDCEVAQALKLANQIRSEVESFQFQWEQTAFQVGVSIGLVVVDDRWENLDSLFSAADAACYIAKNEGRNRVSVYREGAGNASNRQVAPHWVEEIELALQEDRIHIAVQAIQAMRREDEGQRYEVLVRLERPDGSLVMPQSFMPSAERYGLCGALDERVLDLSLRWLTQNPSLLDDIRHISINVSAGTFTRDGAADELIERIEASIVPTEKLCFELQETATIANLSKASAFMQQLAAVGVRFSIDDFGSGLSSFAWLRKLPVDFLKIDGLLVKDVLDDAVCLTMMRAISDVSRSMGRRTVAESVESARLLNAVRDSGIDFAQGFHIGEPELIRLR